MTARQYLKSIGFDVKHVGSKLAIATLIEEHTALTVDRNEYIALRDNLNAWQRFCLWCAGIRL